MKRKLLKALGLTLTVLMVFSIIGTFMAFADDDTVSETTVPGDVNGDGEVDLKDLLTLRNYLANYNYSTKTPAFEVSAGADANGDGKVNILDITELREYLVELEQGGGNEPGEEIDNFSAVYPEDGGTVVLANETVYNWWKSFDGTSKTVPSPMMADVYFPVPVTLEWTCKENATYYLVYVSTNEDMSDAMSFVTNKTSVQVENLFVGYNYYWQVDAICGSNMLRSEVFTFTTADSPRTVTIEGVSNTRDIGGLPTADGNRIAQGMIYRGGKLNDITEKGKQQFLHVLGIKTDYDLRTIGEGGAGVKSPVSDSLKYFNFDGRYYVGPYGKGFDTEEGKAIMADEVRVFADPSNYPVYIHCSLGRDRTGTIVFIIQALCGVERTDLLMDYEMSMFSVSGTLDGGNPFDAIKATYTYINDNYEGDSFAEKTENYLLSIGITAEEIATIRSIMIEEVK